MKTKKINFHMTVGAAFTPEATLNNELRLLKAALLYADTTELCSFKYSLISFATGVEDLEVNQKIDFFTKNIPDLGITKNEQKNLLSFLDKYKSIKTLSDPNELELFLAAKYDAIFNTEIQKHNKALQKVFFDKYGSSTLMRAIRQNLIVLHPWESNEVKEIKSEFRSYLIKAITDRETMAMMNYKDGFDGTKIQSSRGKSSSNAFGRLLEKAFQEPPKKQNNILERLPMFELANINAILDIREELDKPLKKFRTSVVKFSESIKNQPWNQDFANDVKREFIMTFTPVVKEIEDSVKSNKDLQSLGLLRTDEKTKKDFSNTEPATMTMIITNIHSISRLVRKGVSVGETTMLTADFAGKKKDPSVKNQNYLVFFYKSIQDSM